jgi:hypothetical protein
MTLGDTASLRIATTSYARYVALRAKPEKPNAVMPTGQTAHAVAKAPPPSPLRQR